MNYKCVEIAPAFEPSRTPLSRFESALRLNVSASFTVTLISEIRPTNAVAVMAYEGFGSLVRNFTDDQTVGGYYILQP